jgi:hypothetical protein
MKLGTWVHTQRIQYRKLIAGTKKEELEAAEELKEFVKESVEVTEEEVSYRLTEARRERLESVGFIWSAREGEKGNETGRITRNSYDDQWDAMFLRLKEYKDKHADCLVPKRYKEDPKLGTWVDTQVRGNTMCLWRGVTFALDAVFCFADACGFLSHLHFFFLHREFNSKSSRKSWLHRVWRTKDPSPSRKKSQYSQPCHPSP